MMARQMVLAPYVILLRLKMLEPEYSTRKTMAYGRSGTEVSKKPMEIISCLSMATITSMMIMYVFSMRLSTKMDISTRWPFVATRG